ncbi:hypothetical protein GCM10020229_15020 [Kitasatospora albolonga]
MSRAVQVAIKILREELAADPDVVMRFLRERSVLPPLTTPTSSGPATWWWRASCWPW